MPESLPSLHLLAEEAHRERDAVLRHTDAVDTKGGVLLGAAAALTALGTSAPWRIASLPISVAAALTAIGVLWPRDFPARQLQLSRDRYITSDPRFTSLMLLDSTIEIIERYRQSLEIKTRRLKLAASLLVLAGVVQASGTIVQSIGG